MAIEKINFSYPNGSLQSVFDNEEMTALELASKTSKKVDECVEVANGVELIAINATAVVDEMRTAQDQFITENNDIRSELINENQTFITGLNNSKSALEGEMTATLNAFKTDTTASKTSYENGLNASKTTFDEALNTSKTMFEADMATTLNTFKTDTTNSKTNYENTLNISKATFETNMTNSINTINANSETTIRNETDIKVNALINDGTVGNIIGNTYVTPVKIDLGQRGINVANYGVIGDGVADDTTAFQTIISNMPNTGGTILIPSNFKCRLGNILINKPIDIIGLGATENASQIIAKDAISTILNITAIGVKVKNIHFKHSTTRTQGAYIDISGAGRGIISECIFEGYYIGIRHNGTINQIIRDCSFLEGTSRLTSPNGSAILVGDSAYTPSPIIENCLITKLSEVIDNSPEYGIKLQYVDGAFISNVSIIKQNIDCIIQPSTDQFAHGVYITNCMFDSSRNGIILEPKNNATIHTLSISNSWLSGHSDVGLRAISTGTGTVEGVNVSNCHSFQNYDGFFISSRCKHFNITGCTLAKNTDSGIVLRGDSSYITITSNNITPYADLHANNLGISLIETCSNIIVTNNVIEGNTSNQLYNVTTGKNIVIANNIGVPNNTTVTP